MTAMDNTTVVSYSNKRGGTRTYSLLRLVADYIPVTTFTGHSPQGQPHSRLAQCECRPSVQDWTKQLISTKYIFHAQIPCWPSSCGSPRWTCSPQSTSLSFPAHDSILESQALVVDALSQPWQGQSIYMFPPFHLLNKVFQKFQATQSGKVILIALTHLIHLCVDQARFLPYNRDLLSQPGHTLDGRRTMCTHRMDTIMQHFWVAGVSEEVSRLAPALRRHSTCHKYHDRLLRFAGRAME